MIRVEMILSNGEAVPKIYLNEQQAETGIAELKQICREYQLYMLKITKTRMEA